MLVCVDIRYLTHVQHWAESLICGSIKKGEIEIERREYLQAELAKCLSLSFDSEVKYKPEHVNFEFNEANWLDSPKPEFRVRITASRALTTRKAEAALHRINELFRELLPLATFHFELVTGTSGLAKVSLPPNSPT